MEKRISYVWKVFLKHLSVCVMCTLTAGYAFSHDPSSLTKRMTGATSVEIVASSEDRPIVFPDTAHHQTLVVDLHTHSVFSDGHVWPNIRVAEAIKDGLDGLAITEHLEVQPHRRDILHPDRNRAFEIASDTAAGSNLLIIRGSEITRRMPVGHINAVFITDANELLLPGHAGFADDNPSAFRESAYKWPAQKAIDLSLIHI